MTHTAKHTPGPLHNTTGARPGPWIRQVLNDESEAYIHDKHCNAIARVYSLSDAALIAAAPAMYEALKDSLVLLEASYHDMHDKFGAHDLGTLTVFDCVEKVKAALAQADGKQKVS